MLLEFFGRAGEDRHHVLAVVHWDDVLHAEEPGSVGGLQGTHREPVADGQERQVRAVEFADESHVAEEGGVAGVVELEPALELDHVAERFSAVDRAPVVEGEGGGGGVVVVALVPPPPRCSLLFLLFACLPPPPPLFLGKKKNFPKFGSPSS